MAEEIGLHQDLRGVAGAVLGEARPGEKARGKEGEVFGPVAGSGGRSMGLPRFSYARLTPRGFSVYPAPVMSAARPIAIIVISSGGGPPIWPAQPEVGYTPEDWKASGVSFLGERSMETTGGRGLLHDVPDQPCVRRGP